MTSTELLKAYGPHDQVDRLWVGSARLVPLKPPASSRTARNAHELLFYGYKTTNFDAIPQVYDNQTYGTVKTSIS